MTLKGELGLLAGEAHGEQGLGGLRLNAGSRANGERQRGPIGLRESHEPTQLGVFGEDVGELDEQATCLLPAHARHLRHARGILGGDDLGELRRGERGEHGERELGAHARDGTQLIEEGTLVSRGKAVELHGILAHDHAREHRDARLAHMGKGRRRG